MKGSTNPRSIPQNNYTKDELVNSGLFKPGQPVKVVRNNVEEFYYPITRSSGVIDKLHNAQTNETISIDQLTNTKIQVSEVNIEEYQRLKTSNSSAKSFDEVRQLVKSGKVKGVSFKEGHIVSLSQKKATGNTPSQSIFNLVQLTETIRDTDRNRKGETIVNERKQDQTIAIIDKEKIKELDTAIKSQGLELNKKNLHKIRKTFRNTNRGDLNYGLDILQKYSNQKGIDYEQAISEISSSKDKKITVDITKGKPSEISKIIFSNNVGRDTETELSDFKKNKQLFTKKDYAGLNKLSTFEVTATHDESLKFDSELKYDKDIKKTTNQKIAQKYVLDFTENLSFEQRQELFKKTLNFAQTMDSVAGTKISQSMTTDKMKNLNVVTDSRTISGVTIDYNNIDDRSKTERQQNESLRNKARNERKDHTGKIVPLKPNEDVGKVALTKLKEYVKDTTYSDTNFKYNQKIIDKFNPDATTHYYHKHSAAKYNSREKLPSYMKNQTGIQSVVFGLVGTYFYQSMLVNWSQKAQRFLNDKIEPNEVIDGNRHSSIETSIRRILTTDFGGGWSYFQGALRMLKGSVTGKSTEQFTNLKKAFQEKELYIKAKKFIDSPDPGKYNKAFVKIRDTAISTTEEGAKIVTQNPGKVLGFAGGTVVLFNLGSDNKKENTRSLLKQPSHYSQYVDESLSLESDRYGILSPQKRGNTGFGSPFSIFNSTSLYLGKIMSKVGTSVNSVPVKELGEKLSQGGLKMDDLRSGMSWAKSVISEKASNLGLFTPSTKGITRAELELNNLRQSTQDVIFPKLTRHGKVQELNVNMANMEKQISQKQIHKSLVQENAAKNEILSSKNPRRSKHIYKVKETKKQSTIPRATPLEPRKKRPDIRRLIFESKFVEGIREYGAGGQLKDTIEKGSEYASLKIGLAKTSIQEFGNTTGKTLSQATTNVKKAQINKSDVITTGINATTIMPIPYNGIGNTSSTMVPNNNGFVYNNRNVDPLSVNISENMLRKCTNKYGTKPIGANLLG